MFGLMRRIDGRRSLLGEMRKLFSVIPDVSRCYAIAKLLCVRFEFNLHNSPVYSSHESWAKWIIREKRGEHQTSSNAKPRFSIFHTFLLFIPFCLWTIPFAFALLDVQLLWIYRRRTVRQTHLNIAYALSAYRIPLSCAEMPRTNKYVGHTATNVWCRRLSIYPTN